MFSILGVKLIRIDSGGTDRKLGVGCIVRFEGEAGLVADTCACISHIYSTVSTPGDLVPTYAV